MLLTYRLFVVVATSKFVVITAYGGPGFALLA